MFVIMTSNSINELYFLWLKNIACGIKNVKIKTYDSLLRYLHRIKFEYSIPMDGNRAEDGIDLRYRFGCDNGYGGELIANCIDIDDCSMLEMLVALSLRCEEHIMSNPDIGNRTSKWFWIMIGNLGLSNMTNDIFDKDYVDDVIEKFFEHKYKRTGEGGLFKLKHYIQDMRDIDIWKQAMWYLSEYLEEQKEYDA